MLFAKNEWDAVEFGSEAGKLSRAVGEVGGFGAVAPPTPGLPTREREEGDWGREAGKSLLVLFFRKERLSF
jgi:hypothetical protein